MAGYGNKSGAGGRGWRKGQYKYTADELDAKCDQYMTRMQEAGEKPTWQGLGVFLGLPSDTLTEWLGKKADNEDVWRVLKKTADRISHKLQQRTDSMALLSMNQPLYGGFTNRQMDTGGGQISISVSVGKNDDKDAESFGK